MATLLNVKQFVMNQLGSTDTSSNTIRDNLVNQARRQYYNERRWSFLFETATVTITAQVGSTPADYNPKFDPDCVYVYSGGIKYEFQKVEWSELSSYTSDNYVYAINKNTSQIKINQTAYSSVSFDYTRIPADAATDGSADSSTEPAPDITAIGYLAIAYWWLSSERATAKFQMFKDMYDQQLQIDIKIDAANQAVKPLNSLPRSLGYNKRYRNWIQKGYVGGQ